MSYNSPYPQSGFQQQQSGYQQQENVPKNEDEKRDKIKKAAAIAGGVGLAAAAAAAGYGTYKHFNKDSDDGKEAQKAPVSEEKPHSQVSSTAEYEKARYEIRGKRIASAANQEFPTSQAGPAPFKDVGGQPVWVGSAYYKGSLQPCKLAPHLDGKVRFGYEGRERSDAERYDILVVSDDMEWVDAQNSQIPQGRRPVIGGYEADSTPLYHVAVHIQESNIIVPGKIGPQLTCGLIGWGGKEAFYGRYKLLCWK